MKVERQSLRTRRDSRFPTPQKAETRIHFSLAEGGPTCACVSACAFVGVQDCVPWLTDAPCLTAAQGKEAFFLTLKGTAELFSAVSRC